MMTLKIVLAIAVIIGIVHALRALQKMRDAKFEARTIFIQNYKFPVGLRFKMREQYPQLSDAQIDDVFNGLRAWFVLLAKHPKQRFGMPSTAVDAAWHEFILMTRNYETFCHTAFGRFLHHVPNEPGHAGDAKIALARTHALLPTVAGVGLLAAGTASAGLFAIDQTLGIANGNRYDGGDLEALSRLHQEQLARHSSGDSSTSGGGCGGTSVEGDAGSGDGGGDGGGCGGGCGS